MDGRGGKECYGGLTATTNGSSTYTEVISVHPEPSGRYSFAFPTLPAVPPGLSVSTTIILTLPANTTTTQLPISTNMTSATSMASESTTSSTSMASESTTLSISSSSSPSSNSALCFDPTLQRPAHCPSSTTKSAASSTNDGGFPGASTVKSQSQANALLPPFILPVPLHTCYSLGLTVFVFVLGLVMTDLACREHDDQPSTAETAGGRGLSGADIHLVEGSGRVIAGDLKSEARIMKSSGSRFSSGLVVDGERECGLVNER